MKPPEHPNEEKADRARSVRTLIGWIALAAVLGLYGYNQGYKAWRSMHANDFKHIYLGSLLLRHGQNPYDGEAFLGWAGRYGFRTINPYVYPPTTGLILRPLATLSFDEAKRVWFYLNHAMLLGALALCIHLFLGWRDPWRLAAVVLLAATSFPLRRTLTAGQLNCVLLLTYCALCWAERNRRDWAVGLFVGFGTLFKLLPGIFVLYYLAKRRWRALVWTALWSGAILGTSLATMGWRVHAAYLPVVRAMGYGRSVWQERLIAGGQEPFYRDPFNQSPNSLFHHLLAPDPVGKIKPLVELGGAKGRSLADLLTIAASAAIVAAAFLAVRPQKASGSGVDKANGENVSGDRPRDRWELEVALVVTTALLLPSIMWDHYLVVLFLPQIILFAAYLDEPVGKIPRIAAFLAASALLACPVAFGRPEFNHGVGLLAMSAKLGGVLVLFGLTLVEIRKTAEGAKARGLERGK